MSGDQHVANVANVAVALGALGSAYRGDWAEVDGRTIRDELAELAGYLAPDASPFDLDRWYVSECICPVEGCWAEHCRAPGSRSLGCAHLDGLCPTGASS